MKQITLKAQCLMIAGFIGLLSIGCGANDIVNPHQNNSLSDGSIQSGKVFSHVDQMPAFPGGEEALINYLHAHIHYPKVAREDGISGTIAVQFIVDKDGSLSHITTVGPKLGGGLEEESIDVIKNMPKWMPGSEKGEKVNVQYALPVRYVLQ